MDQLVSEAAQAIIMFAGTGAGAAAHGFAERAGANVSDGTLRVIERIQHRLTGRGASEPDVVEALQEALGAGEMTDHDLRNLVAEIGRVQISQKAKTIINGNINAGVFNG